MIEDYQDYSEVSSMLNQEYFLSEQNEDAIKYLYKHEADRFLVTIGRKLKGFEVIRE
ncbi:hypothetical protein F971_02010 [Acinetobacter vivianii]|uniref:Uncharacterized protein n=1 Tax=Acinetobacter vivianii TaxID=1776742 RepID=N8W5M7_9GAMM|nr:hypothetical protein F971_02010 [Acinetobacter vivianii]